MGSISNILDAIRRFREPTQKSALRRQDDRLRGKDVSNRRREVHRSSLGATETFVATVAPTPETIAPLTDGEIGPIAENATLCEQFISCFLKSDRRGIELAHLDSAFELWATAEHKRGYSRDEVIELTGAAFGKLCADSFGMRWIRLSDCDGTVVALQGRAKDFRAFPYQSVSKRIDDGEYGFFRLVFISVEAASKADWAPTAGA